MKKKIILLICFFKNNINLNYSLLLMLLFYLRQFFDYNNFILKIDLKTYFLKPWKKFSKPTETLQKP